MYELALFAGAGGGLLATKWLLGWQTVCYVENNEYCVEVIKARIRDGLLDDAPIWDDVRTFNGQPWARCVDIVTAGFPCQPWSAAGKRKGAKDERNLWPDTVRIIREVRPRWCLLENVPTLITGKHRYYGRILRDLAESRYDVRWRVLSAAEVGAPHKRDRAWIVAYSDSRGIHRGTEPRNGEADRIGVFSKKGKFAQSRIWNNQPPFCRVATGMAHRVDRLKALGNGQVPAVARTVWELLTEDLSQH